MSKPRLVILTGAGFSAESGISTFRDADGLWENYPVMEVASADGFRRNPALVHQFYNDRRASLRNVQPNMAHIIARELEKDWDVTIVTQNVDDLHERAGSSNIIHLHGELTKLRALDNPELLFPVDYDFQSTPATRIQGHSVRPHIVFFQEAVPMIEPAIEAVSRADALIVAGTSLVVYPAAGLLNYARPGIPVFYIDPNPAPTPSNVTVLPTTATKGMDRVRTLLKEN